MKKLLFILLISKILFSQTKSDYLNYFPLHIGNIWTYQLVEYDYFNDDTLDILYLTFTITGDTILQDGYKYFIFTYDERYNHKSFSRIDTTNLIVYDGYFGDFKLDASQDSIWIDQYGQSNRILFDTSTVGNLNIISPQKIYQQGIYFFNRTLSKGFGLSYSETGDLGMHQRRYLVYSKIDGIEYGTPVSVKKDKPKTPLKFNLFQNYPNPFNPVTVINYSIPKQLNTTLKVFDILGKEVKTLVNDNKAKGKHKVEFDASFLPSGIYFYRLQSGNFSETKKLILLK